MGNSASIDHPSDTTSCPPPRLSPLIQTFSRKTSSFLEEPLCMKQTLRGEATMKLNHSNSSNYSTNNNKNNNNPPSTTKLRYAVSEMQGWRSHMEDHHSLLPLSPSHFLLAVFDGHGGNFTSHYLEHRFPRTLLRTEEWQCYLRAEPGSVVGLGLLKSALVASFAELDGELLVAQRGRRMGQLEEMGGEDPGFSSHGVLERSGSTGVVVVITPTHLVCANAGDSRAIMVRRGGGLPLSFDHKPEGDAEWERIEGAGGFVRSGRVDGDLAVSRGFGDFAYKLPGRGERRKVTAEPDIVVYPRDYKGDECIVLACDGVWDRLTNRDCADVVRGCLEEGECDVGLVCEEIIDTALELDSRDNMTCVVVMLPGANMGYSRCDKLQVDAVVSDELMGVMKRRADRERQWGPNSSVASRAIKRLEDRRMKSRELLNMHKLKQRQIQQLQTVREKGKKALSVTKTAGKTAGTKHMAPVKSAVDAGSIASNKSFRTSTNNVIQVQ